MDGEQIMEQTVQNKFRDRYQALIVALLPISFIGTGFTNLVTFPFGLHAYDLARTIVTNGAIALVAILLLGEVWFLWKEKTTSRKIILVTACIPVLFSVFYAIALFIRPNTAHILKTALGNGCFLVSSCCAWLVIALEDRMQQFLKVCRIYALILSPIMLYYCIRFYLPSASYRVTDLGAAGYMTIAYTLLDLCIALAIEMLLFPPDNKKILWLDWSLFLLFSISITLGQCKGPMISLIFLGILCFMTAALQKKQFQSAKKLCLTACLSLVLFSSILYPNHGFENRFLSFLDEFSGEDQVSLSIEQVDKVSQALNQEKDPPTETDPSTGTEPPPETDPSTETEPTELPVSMDDIVTYFYNGEAEADLLAGKITQAQYDEISETAQLLNSTNMGGRLYLWLCAIKEIKAAPLFGNGIMAYESKYETDPHNFYLNLATDFGLVITVIVILIGLLTFIKMILLSKVNINILAFTLYIFVYLPNSMIGRSVYSSTAFFQYGMCLVLVWYMFRDAKDTKITRLSKSKEH